MSRHKKRLNFLVISSVFADYLEKLNLPLQFDLALTIFLLLFSMSLHIYIFNKTKVGLIIFRIFSCLMSYIIDEVKELTGLCWWSLTSSSCSDSKLQQKPAGINPYRSIRSRRVYNTSPLIVKDKQNHRPVKIVQQKITYEIAMSCHTNGTNFHH